MGSHSRPQNVSCHPGGDETSWVEYSSKFNKPKRSMYDIFTYIYHKRSTIRVDKYTSPMDGMGLMCGKVGDNIVRCTPGELERTSLKSQCFAHTFTARVIPFLVRNPELNLCVPLLLGGG